MKFINFKTFTYLDFYREAKNMQLLKKNLKNILLTNLKKSKLN